MHFFLLINSITAVSNINTKNLNYLSLQTQTSTSTTVYKKGETVGKPHARDWKQD